VLLLCGDFFTGVVLATALTKLILPFNELTCNNAVSNTLGVDIQPFLLFGQLEYGCPDHDLHHPCQTKFVTMPLNEDSDKHILNCILTLNELDPKPAAMVYEIFLKDFTGCDQS
jgi:coatomer subunit beta